MRYSYIPIATLYHARGRE